MPNWVFCSLEIKANSPEKLNTIKEKVSDDHSDFSFNKIITRPANEEDNWYDWNIANWGTKWDASDVVLNQSTDSLSFSFSTPWSPPLPVIEELIKDKDIELHLFYEEEQGWGGEIKARDGVFVEEKIWDIPNSHSEASKRHGGCYCIQSDEQYFSDCFVTRAQEIPGLTPKILEFVKGLAPSWSEGFESLISASKKLENHK